VAGIWTFSHSALVLINIDEIPLLPIQTMEVHDSIWSNLLFHQISNDRFEIISYRRCVFEYYTNISKFNLPEFSMFQSPIWENADISETMLIISGKALSSNNENTKCTTEVQIPLPMINAEILCNGSSRSTEILKFLK
jgi:hypothetical protein